MRDDLKMHQTRSTATLKEDGEDGLDTRGGPSPVSDFRRALPQYLAAMAKNLLLFDLGMVIAFPTIVIPPLLKSMDGLHLNLAQASWLGSMVYLCQPLGSLSASATLDFLGRKRSMMVLNLPFFVCWMAMYYVQTIPLIFFISGVMGFTIGSIEASILTYVGEISEPKLRGTLTSMAEIARYMGFVFIFFLGTLTDWRTSALISAAVPLISILALTQVPETPIWLLSRGRAEESLQALCWLRGWAQPEQVAVEFEELKRYNTASKILSVHHKNATIQINGLFTGNEDMEKTQPANSVQNLVVELPQNKVPLKEKISDFFRREMMLPMFLVCSFFLFTYGSGMLAFRPYMVPVFTHFGILMDPYLATAVFTSIGLGGTALCMIIVRRVGKRPIALVSVAGCGLSALCLGTYAYYIDEMSGQRYSWIPQTLMIVYAFCTGFGMDPLPWMYLCEVFPFRGRGLACGIAAGISYVMGFIATKTYLILETKLTFAGVFFLYGCFGVVGTIYFYLYLPETEGRSMEEIEEGYKKKRSQTS